MRLRPWSRGRKYVPRRGPVILASNHLSFADHFFGALPRLVWHEDEPIAHPSSVPLYYVSTLARQHVTVVLTGEGSDELLAGYGKYLRTAWNWRANVVYERLVPGSIRASVARSVPHMPGRLKRYARRSFLAVDGTPEAMVFDNFAAIRLADQHELLTADLFAISITDAKLLRQSLQAPLSRCIGLQQL